PMAESNMKDNCSELQNLKGRIDRLLQHRIHSASPSMDQSGLSENSRSMYKQWYERTEKLGAENEKNECEDYHQTGGPRFSCTASVRVEQNSTETLTEKYLAYYSEQDVISKFIRSTFHEAPNSNSIGDQTDRSILSIIV
ncbi:hypothetical protein L9F63_010776, partial [Diploptera punctata]